MEKTLLAQARNALDQIEGYRPEDLQPECKTAGTLCHSQLCDTAAELAQLGERLASFMEPAKLPATTPLAADPLEGELGPAPELQPEQRVRVREAGDEEIVCFVPDSPPK